MGAEGSYHYKSDNSRGPIVSSRQIPLQESVGAHVQVQDSEGVARSTLVAAPAQAVQLEHSQEEHSLQT